MNIKKIWLVLPAVFIPYAVIIDMVIIFFSTKNPIARFIMESIFMNSIFPMLWALFFYIAIASALVILCFIACIVRNWNALSMAKTAMIIKLLQIPTYVVIFVLSLFLTLTIFTYPIAFMLFLVDCLTLTLSGLLNIAAVVLADRQNTLSYRKTFWIIISQLIFCADVVASIAFFIMLKKKKRTALTKSGEST